jgi:predicted dehydrogenase
MLENTYLMPDNHLTRRALITATCATALLADTAGDVVRLPRRVRIGLIGFDGHPSEILGQLGRLPDVELAAYAVDGSDPATLESNLKNPAVQKARQYQEYGAMLEQEKLDLAAICNSDGRRTNAILACAAKGLHVISEKPLALNRRDLAAVRQAFSRPTLHLGCLLPMRFSSPFLAMKQIVDSGVIGEVLQITGQKSYNLGTRPEWQRQRDSYGSTVLWIGPHMIDLMRYCSGRELVEVAGYQSRVGHPEAGDMEDVTAAIYKLDNGGVATLHMDYLRPDAAPGHGDDRLRLAGTKGIVEYLEALGVVVLSGKAKPSTLTSLPPEGSVFLDFIQSVYLGKPAKLSIADIYRVNEIALATHEASRDHRFQMT